MGDRQTGKLKEAGDVPARSTGRIRRGRRGAAAVAAGLLVLVAAGAGAWLYKSSGGEQKKPVVIAIISAEGGRPLKTFPLPREGEAFANVLRWTPDGSAVVYARVSEGVSNLWAQPLDGKPARQITDFTSERIFWFDFSHDGKQLALTRGTQAGDVVLIKDFR